MKNNFSKIAPLQTALPNSTRISLLKKYADMLLNQKNLFKTHFCKTSFSNPKHAYARLILQLRLFMEIYRVGLKYHEELSNTSGNTCCAARLIPTQNEIVGNFHYNQKQ
jgi:hypothetical protein